jgi:hypothetical protein
MSPSQPQATPAPVSADVYSESIEQQFAIVHDFLSPLGAVLMSTDPWVRRQLATPSELARHVAKRGPLEAVLHHRGNYPGDLFRQSQPPGVHLHS